MDFSWEEICSYDVTDILLSLGYFYLLTWCLRLIQDHRSSWSSGQANGLIWYDTLLVLINTLSNDRFNNNNVFFIVESLRTLLNHPSFYFSSPPTPASLTTPPPSHFPPLSLFFLYVRYLVCTSILCTFRSIGFFLIPIVDRDCNDRFKSWQWEIDGSGDSKRIFNFILTVLSTASSGLFFTSYTYFAHSLAIVLDMLTSDHASASASADSKFLIILLGLNICVWISITSLWAATFFNSSYLEFIDNVAQVSIAFAALTTCTMFSIHFLRAWSFLRRNFGRDGGRAAQLDRLFRLRRVIGVCRVCTVCFAVRAILLLTRTSVGPLLEDFYFLTAEALPTAYMLYAFKSSENSASGSGSSDNAAAEFEDLKASITSNVTLVHGSPITGRTSGGYHASPIRAAFTRGFYATPEKSSGEEEGVAMMETSRLLSTPGSIKSSASSNNIDTTSHNDLIAAKKVEMYL